MPDATRLSNIKIFSTWYPTTRRIPWLMLDHTYFMQTIHENVGYNQPTNVGFYMGSEMTDAEIWEAFAKVNGWNAAPAIVGDVNGDGTVDVADIAAIIDIMAGSAATPLPSGGAGGGPADVNGDGTVDVADIAAVIDIMAGAAPLP